LRRYPRIEFKQEREAGNDVLDIQNLNKTIDGKPMFKDLSIHVGRGDKIALVGRNDRSKTTLFQILAGELKADSGSFKWGVTTSLAYFPKDNKKYFDTDLNLIDWLRQFSAEKNEEFIRGFLGSMLFTGEESLKKVNVLSGGEKVRCLFSRMMLTGANVLLLDEPTNHLDLESIASLNTSLEQFRGTVIFASHDHQFIQTVANRIIEVTPNGSIDRPGTTLDEYLSNEKIQEQRAALYQEQPTLAT
jgi:ATPase subunit of ABC transporter with duplicated ATPase domains